MAHVPVSLLPARPALFGAALQKSSLLKEARTRFGVTSLASAVDSLSIDLAHCILSYISFLELRNPIAMVLFFLGDWLLSTQ